MFGKPNKFAKLLGEEDDSSETTAPPDPAAEEAPEEVSEDPAVEPVEGAAEVAEPDQTIDVSSDDVAGGGHQHEVGQTYTAQVRLEAIEGANPGKMSFKLVGVDSIAPAGGGLEDTPEATQEEAGAFQEVTGEEPPKKRQVPKISMSDLRS